MLLTRTLGCTCGDHTIAFKVYMWYPCGVNDMDFALLQVHYSDEEQLFSPKQLIAMFLTYLKQTTEKAISKPVADCVISVSFLTLCIYVKELKSSLTWIICHCFPSTVSLNFYQG